MIASANNAAASAVKSLRVKALLDEVPKTHIASKVGLNRMTVGKHLKSDDMSLSEFIKTAFALNANPAQVLARPSNPPRQKKRHPPLRMPRSNERRFK